MLRSACLASSKFGGSFPSQRKWEIRLFLIKSLRLLGIDHESADGPARHALTIAKPVPPPKALDTPKRENASQIAPEFPQVCAKSSSRAARTRIGHEPIEDCAAYASHQQTKAE
jgi:hypothetical protein